MSAEVSTNPVINAKGQAVLPTGVYCTWHTTNGTTSMITITNQGGNTLTFRVDGAPQEVSAVGPENIPKPFNGVWTLPANQPTAQVTAATNFKGTTVTIMNVSHPGTECQVIATAG